MNNFERRQQRLTHEISIKAKKKKTKLLAKNPFFRKELLNRNFPTFQNKIYARTILVLFLISARISGKKIPSLKSISEKKWPILLTATNISHHLFVGQVFNEVDDRGKTNYADREREREKLEIPHARCTQRERHVLARSGAISRLDDLSFCSRRCAFRDKTLKFLLPRVNGIVRK